MIYICCPKNPQEIAVTPETVAGHYNHIFKNEQHLVVCFQAEAVLEQHPRKVSPERYFCR